MRRASVMCALRPRPAAALAGRLGGIVLRCKAKQAAKDIDFQIVAGYAPQNKDPENIRNLYHTEINKMLRCPSRRTTVRATDGNARTAPSSTVRSTVAPPRSFP